MTSAPPMTRQELLELAALDAFSLLDEYEAALYDRAYHDAAAAVQDEIRQLQAGLASDETLLPEDEPSALLRQRVLEAVAKAVDKESVRFSPLATIGRRAAVQDVIGQIPLSRSGQFWRAAAFVLAGIVIVLAFFWSDAYRYGHRIAEYALNQTTTNDVKRIIGSTYEDFVGNPNCSWVFLKADDSDQRGMVSIIINEQNHEVFMLAMGLPASSGPYTLQLRSNGRAEELRRFMSNGSLASARCEALDPTRLAASVWEIADAAGIVLFSST